MNSHGNLEINGNLRRHSPAELLAEIARVKLNGSLRLASAARKTIVYFDAGEAVYAVSNARRFRLSELLASENKITKEQLAAIVDSTNDLALREHLIESELLSKSDADAAVARQIRSILTDAFDWLGEETDEPSGEWIFSPLVRVKGDVRFDANQARLLVEHARSLPDAAIALRLRNASETFAASASMPAYVDLLPEEAFVFSRFESHALRIEEAAMFGGLPEHAALRIVYTLWLAGFLRRADWDAPFTERALAAISSANLTLKKPVETARIVRETKNELPHAVGDDTSAEQTKTASPIQEQAPPVELTLEKYLERIEAATNFYAVFDVAFDASAAELKRCYLALAKRFHPDLFRRQVDAERFLQIQTAFTRIAQAYETLKNEKSREVYDYKLRKESVKTENVTTTQTDTSSSEERAQQIKAAQAAADFENGFDFLMDENAADALPFLARAAHLSPETARYRAYFGKALSSENNQKHKAEAEMQAAVRLEPNNADFRLMLAEFFAQMNLPKRAEGELNRLLTVSPDNREAQLLLDKLAKKV